MFEKKPFREYYIFKDLCCMLNHCEFFLQASDKELIWVIRIGIFLVGGLSTVMALTIKSIYGLWALCSDLVFVILFPQLLCAIYVPFVNTYGSLAAFIIGLVLRLGGGEPVIGLKPFIKYPLFDEGLNKQMFPFRTLAMAVSLVTLLVVSYITMTVFKSCNVSTKFDFFKSFEAKEEKKVRGISFKKQYDSTEMIETHNKDI